MSAKNKSTCESATKWLREVKGKCVLAALTGQDYAALRIFAHALELYGYSDGSGREAALRCMHYAVIAMQPKTQWIARETIAWWFDWDTHETLWPQILNASACSVEKTKAQVLDETFEQLADTSNSMDQPGPVKIGGAA